MEIVHEKCIYCYDVLPTIFFVENTSYIWKTSINIKKHMLFIMLKFSYVIHISGS